MNYPKLDGNAVKDGLQKLAEGIGALGIIAILYKGMEAQTETVIVLAKDLKIKSKDFRALAQKILDGCHSKNFCAADKACGMLAAATDSEWVILFAIHKDGAVNVTASQPNLVEFAAGFALQIANSFDAMN